MYFVIPVFHIAFNVCAAREGEHSQPSLMAANLFIYSHCMEWDHEFRLGPTYMFYLYSWLNSLWHRFNTVLTTYLRDFGLY